MESTQLPNRDRREGPYVYTPSFDESERIAKINTLFKMFDIIAHAYIKLNPQYWPEPVFTLLDKQKMNLFDTIDQLERASSDLIQRNHGTHVDL